MANSRICSIEDCGKPHNASGFCGMHYARWKRRGDPHKRNRIACGEAQQFFDEIVLAYEGDECLPWPFSKDHKGYGIVRHDGRNHSVHRLSCAAQHGAPPSPLHQAAHSCGKGHMACCAKRHVSWKTPLENTADKRIHGTHLTGERCRSAKLTRAIVEQIRSLSGKLSQREIGEKFGVGQSNVSRLLSGELWPD